MNQSFPSGTLFSYDTALVDTGVKLLRTVRWAPAYLWQRLSRRSPGATARHLIIMIADHFEPSFVAGVREGRASREEQRRRLDRWCQRYPKVASRWRDSGGYPFRHTYFYPAEQYVEALIGRLAEHCRAGWGEIEVHLHHGMERPDTAENTRRTLVEFRD